MESEELVNIQSEEVSTTYQESELESMMAWVESEVVVEEETSPLEETEHTEENTYNNTETSVEVSDIIPGTSSEVNEVNEVLEGVEEVIEEVVTPPQVFIATNDVVITNVATSRYSGAPWFEKIQTREILLAGLGGIGSYVGFLLGRINPRRIILYDFDTVERVNLSGQLFKIGDIGKSKASVVSQIINNYSDYHSVSSYNQRFADSTTARDIMICGFDNMEARRTYYSAWLRRVLSLPKSLRQDCLFIDGRLAAEEYEILCITGDDEYSQSLYEKEFLFSNEEAAPTNCSFKQTSYMAMHIAGTMVNLLINFIAKSETDYRYLPMYTSYSAPSMQLIQR